MNHMDSDLIKFVEFLKRNKIRATYGAIAEAAEIPQRSVGARLGDRCPMASWVVSASTREPTGYFDGEKDPDLHIHEEIIKSGEDLIRRMKKGKR